MIPVTVGDHDGGDVVHRQTQLLQALVHILIAANLHGVDAAMLRRAAVTLLPGAKAHVKENVAGGRVIDDGVQIGKRLPDVFAPLTVIRRGKAVALKVPRNVVVARPPGQKRKFQSLHGLLLRRFA